MSQNSQLEVRFPLIDLCENLPQRNATLELVESREDLGLCFPGSDMDRLFGQNRKLYDRNGNLIRITNFHPKPRFSLFEKLRAIVLPFSIYRIVQVDLEITGAIEPEEFREKIQVLLESDPGDLLLQFRDTSAWKKKLEKHRQFPDLFDFAVEGVKPSQDAPSFQQDLPV